MHILSSKITQDPTVIYTGADVPTEINIKTFQSSHQNPSKNWVNKCIRMKEKINIDAGLCRRIENGMINLPLEQSPPIIL